MTHTEDSNQRYEPITFEVDDNSAHDFGLALVSSPLPGPAWTVFAQWVTLGAGPTWPGGVSEAVRMYVR